MIQKSPMRNPTVPIVSKVWRRKITPTSTESNPKKAIRTRVPPLGDVSAMAITIRTRPLMKSQIPTMMAKA